MKKVIIGLSFLICASGIFFGAGTANVSSLSINAEPTPTTVTLTANDFDLRLPESYAQYLPLSNVGGVAIHDGYIAVANGDTIYVYNGNEYLAYNHEAAVVQLQMNDESILYFLDENGNLHTMDCKQPKLTAEKEGTSCSAFTLAGDILYYAMSVTGKTNIYMEGYSSRPIDTLTSPVTNVPAMAYANGELYYTDGQRLKNTSGKNYALGSDVYNLTVRGDRAYYTDKNGFYVYDMASETVRHSIVESNIQYTAIGADGNYLYIAGVMGRKTKICRYDATKEVFDDYEIGTSSTAKNRLVSAKTSIVIGNYLITADENRVSIYDFVTEEFKSFSCSITPTYVASNGNSLLIANYSSVYIYDFDGKMMADSISDFSGNIIGITAAKGCDYLLATRYNSYYRIDANTFKIVESHSKNNISTISTVLPNAMCGDIYGNVYVNYDGNIVYKYTEAQFLSTSLGEAYYTFPSFATATLKNIAVDFNGKLYGLFGNTLCVNDGTRYVLNETGRLFRSSAILRGFAFGYEYGTIYFLYDDYILSTDAIPLPYLKNIPAGDVYKTVFEKDNTGGVIDVVALEKSAVLLHFTPENLKEDDALFPYDTYSLAGEAENALVLGETNVFETEYYVVSVFDAKTRKYTAGLVRKNACTELDDATYASDPIGFQSGLGYVTNDVLLYKYPYMTKTLSETKLSKNSVVQVLKELSLGDKLIDYDYYYVSYTNGNEVIYGYVPKNFIRNFSNDPAQNESVYHKTLLSKTDVVVTAQNNVTLTLKADKKYFVTAYYSDGEPTDVVRISYEENGITYYATVSTEDFEESSLIPLRYYIVILLVVLDFLIVVNYLIFRKTGKNKSTR